MKRTHFYLCLLILLLSCSKKTSDGFIKVKPEHLTDDVRFDFEAVRNHYDSIFSSGKNPEAIYRLRVLDEKMERIIEIKSDKIITHTYFESVTDDAKTQGNGLRITASYNELIQKEFLILIDSAFWSNPVIDNTDKVFDGSILEIEGIREGQYKKIHRKAWSKDPDISLLEKYFKSH